MTTALARSTWMAHLFLAGLLVSSPPAWGQDATAAADSGDEAAATDDAEVDATADEATDAEEAEARAARVPRFSPPPGAKKLPKPDEVWIDADKKLVYVDGYVSLREGYLEMFACLEGTKEHESVVAVRSSAATVHAALISIGAKPGSPVQYRPKFRPPSGDVINIDVLWLDQKGKVQKSRAQDWVREVKSKKPMKQVWVFAGSGFYTDPDTGKRYYTAEGGDFICVSNFTTATLDVPIESSKNADGLLFEANPDKTPELGTPVRLVLSVQKPDEKK